MSDLDSSSLSIEQLETLGLPLFEENADLEVKAALGANGRGELPIDFWPSYSAMANTDGGRIILGIREVRDRSRRAGSRFLVVGIQDLHKVQKQLWDGLNNRQLVSRCILRNQDVAPIVVHGKNVLEIVVRRASRKEKPVYVKENPLTGTYRRNFEGDYLCDPDAVRRMIADAEHDSLDARILSKFGLPDIEDDSLRSYRRQMSATSPTHPYLSLDDRAFLKSLGGIMRNRETDEEGLTVAGLLMFGKHEAIREAIPKYNVDYREVPEGDDIRWSDRIVPDGTWSGNLFDFYVRVRSRLLSDIKVPFRIASGQRIDDSHVGEALREALVNTIIHADYAGDMSVMIEKRKEYFTFRNPGVLRVSSKLAFEGNHSDCRNRTLQNMFMLVGAAEKAGSGLPKIARAWREQKWYFPLLRDQTNPEQTSLTLNMHSLLSEESMQRLRERFGPETIADIQPDEAMALCTADMEHLVTNARMQDLSAVHPREITKLLQGLVAQGLLEGHGATSGTYYTLVRHSESTVAAAEEMPYSDTVIQVQNSGRSSDELVKAAILEVATDFMIVSQIALILGRSAETIRRRHIPELVRDGLLEPKYRTPSHPGQAYRAKRPG